MSNGFGQPPPGGWGPPPGQQPPHGHPPHQPAHGGYAPPASVFGAPVAQHSQAVPINADIALFLGIGVAMFCGCLPGGVLAIYLADLAKKAARRGDAVEAQSKLKASYITSAVSILILVAIPCVYMAFMLLLGGAGAVLGSV